MKTLVVLRHAHRDKSLGRDTDNGISPKGKKQAKLAARFFESRFLEESDPGKVTFLSSPKLRCLETVKPLAEKLDAVVQVSSDLDEGGNLTPRIQSFIKSWSQSDSALTVICSHGDWIPVFFEKLLGVSIDLKKGAWAEVESDGSSHRLTWLVQEFKTLD